MQAGWVNRWNVVVVAGAMLSTAQANELEKRKGGFRERDQAPARSLRNRWRNCPRR